MSDKPMLEAALQRKMVKHARDDGTLVYKLSAEGQRAVPDLLHFRLARALLVEAKREGEKATKLQLHEHKKLRAVGQWVYVVDNLDDYKFLYAEWIFAITSDDFSGMPDELTFGANAS